MSAKKRQAGIRASTAAAIICPQTTEKLPMRCLVAADLHYDLRKCDWVMAAAGHVSSRCLLKER